MIRERLPEHLAWNGEHASEAALVALADAQIDVVPESVLSHLETCTDCNRVLADLATLSIAAEQALSQLPASELRPATAQVVRLPIPWRALLVAAAVAALGATPALLEAPGAVTSMTTSAVHLAPALMKALTQLFQAEHRSVWLTVASAVLLLVVGFAITRALPTPKRDDFRGVSR